MCIDLLLHVVTVVSMHLLCLFNLLLCRVQNPTRAEVQHLLGEIQSKIDYLTQEIDFYERPNAKLDGYARDLEAKSSTQSAVRGRATDTYVQKELECSVQNMGIATSGDSCAALLSSSSNLTDALNNEADSIANAGDYKWASANKERHINKLNETRAELVGLRAKVRASVGEVDPFSGGITQSDPDVIEAIIDSKKGDKWLEFEFDSEEMESQTTVNTYSRSYKLSGRAKFLGFTVASGSVSGGISGRDLSYEMSQANLKAKGKLLRVHIKRPWFKPEVFDDRNLDFVSYATAIVHRL